MDRYRLYEEHRSSRIWELDFVRGFCIVLMILDHTLYDLAYIFRPQWFSGQKASGILYELTNLASSGYFPWILRDAGWWAAVFCFIFICGISCSFSHSNFKRGLRLAAVALLLTAVTYGLDLLLEQQNRFTIRFGILHMLAASILLYCLIKRKGFLFMMLLSIVCIAAGMYFMRFPLSGAVDYIALLVKSTTKFYSADYFPLLPWFGFFLAGAAMGPFLYREHRSLWPRGGASHWKRPILFIGRHSLVFYILHQPLVYAVLSLAGKIFIKQ
ncbi:MAG TPA: heparan-alpha-glucosaminide N-acetyltransferase [Bacillota bacterium]|jgi:uncharacterized membrane protein|nr:heparan-alpha-glucosaminide N-acetyltransferase [Bacillota bacterium]